jgi:hypothetical protein
VTSDVYQSIPRDLFLIVKENLEHSDASFQIGIVELVSSVPTKGSKLSAFLHNSVEERKTEDKLAPDFGLLTVVELLLRKFGVGTFQVSFDTSRGFSRHLDTVLQG